MGSWRVEFVRGTDLGAEEALMVVEESWLGSGRVGVTGVVGPPLGGGEQTMAFIAQPRELFGVSRGCRGKRERLRAHERG